MSNIEEYKDGYFNYLVNLIIDTITSTDAYDCRDFELMKLELIMNIRRMFSSRETYNKNIEILRNSEKPLYEKVL